LEARAATQLIEQVVREHWGRVLSILTARLRDLDLAEDVLQDALLIALQKWSREGVPGNPAGWLLKTAQRKAIDRLRRDANLSRKKQEIRVLQEIEVMATSAESSIDLPDERLSLMFTCCHPALAGHLQVALTLHTLGGISTAEIAGAYLVSEPAMAQRLVRAKRKIRDAGIPYRVPPPELWSEKMASVLAVIYLIFNEGYKRSAGENLASADLCREAIRLGRILATLAPREPEAGGLLALMILHDSRRKARCTEDGDLVTLELQDRSLWNQRMIEAGLGVLHHALSIGRVGPYQLQAAISAVHAQAVSYEVTDWGRIVGLYDRLYELQPSPVVRLNQAVAVCEARGPRAALAIVRTLEKEGRLKDYQPFYAALAEILSRCGEAEESARAYQAAIERSHNQAEAAFLQKRLKANIKPAS
jgi:RNA polymerase sigma-70 factor (ECF subfamily)